MDKKFQEEIQRKVDMSLKFLLGKKSKEPNCCAFCFKETKFPDDKFCSPLCELDYNEPQKPRTRRLAAIIKIAGNGDESFHD